MARLNIEDSIYSDERFLYVVKKIGRYEAMGQFVFIAKLAQRYWKENQSLIPKDIYRLGEYSVFFNESKLVKEFENGFYLSGSEENFAWIFANVENGKKGGRPSKNNKLIKPIDNPSEPIQNPLTPTLTPTLSQINIYTVEKELIELWNSKKITKKGHNLSDSNYDKVKKVLGKCKDYSIDEIKQAIESYVLILQDEGYLWSHKYSLWDFLTRGKRFFPDEFDIELFDLKFSKPNHSKGVPIKKILKVLSNYGHDSKRARKELAEDWEFIEKHPSGWGFFKNASEFQIRQFLSQAS